MANQTKSKFVPLTQAHLELIELRDIEIEDFGIARLQALSALAQNGNGMTCIADGRVLACFGHYQYAPGFLEMWLIPSIFVPEYAMLVSRRSREYILSIFSQVGVRRLQTSSPDDPFHNRWMQFLGFEREGVMRKLGQSGRDYAMWAMINDRNDSSV